MVNIHTCSETLVRVGCYEIYFDKLISGIGGLAMDYSSWDHCLWACHKFSAHKVGTIEEMVLKLIG